MRLQMSCKLDAEDKPEDAAVAREKLIRSCFKELVSLINKHMEIPIILRRVRLAPTLLHYA